MASFFNIAKIKSLLSGTIDGDKTAQYPDLCPEFTDCFRKAARFLAESVEREDVKGSFGDDHTARAKHILGRLGLNDRKEVC